MTAQTETAKTDDQLVFLPLGGVGEIGMNFGLYGFGPARAREWIVVDCGVTFPGPELPGVDLVLPDISFIAKQRKHLKAIVITHAHEDHYGALVALWSQLRVPVYATPFAAGLLEAKRQSEPNAPDIPVKIFRGGDILDLGPFQIQAIQVAHSIPEPMALAIRTPVGTVLHTGDWKIDEDPVLRNSKTDAAALQALGDEGVLGMVCDSTNAMREGDSPTESSVSDGIADVIRNSKGRVAITTFSSNVGRIRAIAEASARVGRQVLVLGRSLKRVIEVASELGYLDGIPDFLAEEDYQFLPPEKTVILCTGSQGENRAALAKLARGEFRNISLGEGDTVVYSSRKIPGNEKAILDVKNGLVDLGVRVIEDTDALVHVSGHPRRNELRQMYAWVKPQIAVPVHGEAAHLSAHAELATEIGVPFVGRVRNGDMFLFGPGTPGVIEQVKVGRIYKDGNVIGDENFTGVSERRKLSYAGHVVVSVLMDDQAELIDEPEIVAMGTPQQTAEGQDFEEMLLEAVESAFISIPKRKRKDLDMVQEALRRAVRSTCDRKWGRKPVATVFVIQV